MNKNHRFALKISTTISIYLSLLCSVGVVLGIFDLFLGWDILPAWIDMYAKSLFTVFGILFAVSIITSVVCSISIIAEAKAYTVYGPSSKLTKKSFVLFGSIFLIVFLMIFIPYQKDQFDKKRAEKEKTAKKIEEIETRKKRFEEYSNTLDSLVVTIIKNFPIEIIESVTLTESMSRDEKLFTYLKALSASLPDSPSIEILKKVSPPYKYCKFNIYNNELQRTLYTDIVDKFESSIIDNLFNGKYVYIDKRFLGIFINTSNPSIVAPINIGDASPILIKLSYKYAAEDVYQKRLSADLINLLYNK